MIGSMPMRFPLWTDAPKWAEVPKGLELRKGASAIGEVVVIVDPRANTHIAVRAEAFDVAVLPTLISALQSRVRDYRGRLTIKREPLAPAGSAAPDLPLAASGGA